MAEAESLFEVGHQLSKLSELKLTIAAVIVLPDQVDGPSTRHIHAHVLQCTAQLPDAKVAAAVLVEMLKRRTSACRCVVCSSPVARPPLESEGHGSEGRLWRRWR